MSHHCAFKLFVWIMSLRFASRGQSRGGTVRKEHAVPIPAGKMRPILDFISHSPPINCSLPLKLAREPCARPRSAYIINNVIHHTNCLLLHTRVTNPIPPPHSPPPQ